MEPQVRATLFWGCVAVLLFATLASIAFCMATEGILQSDECFRILGIVRRLPVWPG